MEITSAYKFRLPGPEDFADIADINENFGKLDVVLGTMATDLSERGTEWRATLTAAAWPQSWPYRQTVQVPGMRENKKLLASVEITGGMSESNIKLLRKAAGLLISVDTAEDAIIVQCLKRPAVTFNLVCWEV